MTAVHGSGAEPSSGRVGVGWQTIGPWVTVGVVVLAWGAIGRLGWAFLGSDLGFRYVAEHSRRSAPWWYRLAGVWGGMEGSLLLFAAILAGFAAIAAWRVADPRRAMLAGLIGGAVVAISLGFAWPFERLDVPAVDGFGLTPILEHWAMTIHPPLLYVGLAATLPPFLGVAATRRWLLAALAALTLAMSLGGWWSYAEQGWGGYWAWDPVENGSLAPWLAVLVAVHARTRGRAWPARVPFVVALGGAAISRSGAVPSVHAFAEAGGIGFALGVLAALLAALVVSDAVPVRRRSPSAITTGWPLLPVVLAAGALIEVTVLTIFPLIVGVFDDGREPRIAGTWFARLLAPGAVAVVGGLVALALRERRRLPWSVWVAHTGMVVLLVGILGSTFDRTSSATIDTGSTERIAGVDVRNLGVEIEPGARPGSEAVVATLELDGHRVSPALVAHPDRGGVLPETALVSRPWRDLQVALVRADDAGRVLVELRVKSFVQPIWLGALLIVAGSLLRLRLPHRPTDRLQLAAPHRPGDHRA